MIGYYIHHHGLGHLTRAQSIAAACDQPVVALSSLPRPASIAPFADWVPLPRDDDATEPADIAAGGQLHWAPVGDPGYAARMQVLAAWIGTAQPAAVVVDVSVEVTALARLLGVRVVVVAGPGVRLDPPHRLAYALASRIVVPWPESVYRPAYLDDYRPKTSYVGAISRFDGLVPRPVDGSRTVLSLFGRGGSGGHRDGPARRGGGRPDLDLAPPRRRRRMDGRRVGDAAGRRRRRRARRPECPWPRSPRPDGRRC